MYAFFKRLLDIAVAAPAIVVLSPVLVTIALLVKFGSPGPVIYRGERVGLKGEHFHIYKFRTMVADAEKGSATTSNNDPRITPVGRYLRAYKLDELPQLFNVLFGSMSLVGPRPEIPRFVAKYTEEQRHILDAKPGVTDLASIHFRKMSDIIDDSNPETSYLENVWETKNALRLEYVRSRSFLLDLRIMWRTLVAVVIR